MIYFLNDRFGFNPFEILFRKVLFLCRLEN